MCRTDTIRTKRNISRAVAASALLCELALGQTVPQPASVPNWRKLGNESVGMNLAGPAGGPVESVWFSPAGDHLYARLKSGHIFETANFADWILTKTPTAAPDPAARVQSQDGRTYTLG